jgi:hypothetical protein
MAVIFLFIYFLQYAIYPKILFGVRAGEDRGTIRIFIPGGSFAGFMYYYFLQKAFTSEKKYYFIYCLIFLAVPVLQGTRSSVLVLLLGTFIFILFNRQVKSKIIVTFLIAISALFVYFIFQDIIMNMIDVSKSQASQDDDDIRVRAAKFFLYEFSPTTLNYWIGNGESHMASAYGMKVFFYKSSYGFFQNDLGLLGEYTKYGLLWIIAVFFLLRQFFIYKIERQYTYIKFWAAILILDELMGGTFSKSPSIIVITGALYIIDVSIFEINHSDEKPDNKIATD